MKIAILAPVYAPIKEREDYGGVEYFIKVLANGLKKRGHKITLFASKDSKLNSINLIKTDINAQEVNRSISLNVLPKFNKNDERFIQAELFGKLNERHHEFDLVINNAPNWFSIYSGSLLTKPMVTVLHTTIVQEELKQLFKHTKKNFHLVGNSHSTTKIYEKNGLPVEKTIYHGLDVNDIPWSKESGKFLIFAGRMLPYKGPEIAIEIAERSNIPLKIAGRIQDENYFQKIIKPKLGTEIEYLGFLSRKELLKNIAKSLCLLQTSTVQESFGLTTLESLSCGTPVIGFNLGATPEIVTDGKSGFILKTQSAMEASRKVKEIQKINRADCRKEAEKFTAEKMLDEYEKYFYQLSAVKK